MQKEKKERQNKVRGFRCSDETWEKIVNRKKKTERTLIREIEIIIEAGLEKLEKEEKNYYEKK